MGEGRRLPHGSCVHHTQGHAHGVWTERSQDRAVAVAVYGRGQNSPAPQPPRGHIHEEMMICLPCGPFRYRGRFCTSVCRKIS